MKHRAILYPAITDRETLLIEFFRAIWYLAGTRDTFAGLHLVVGGEAAELDLDTVIADPRSYLPDTLDPRIVDLTASWAGAVEVTEDPADLAKLPGGAVMISAYRTMSQDEADFADRLVRRYGGLVQNVSRTESMGEAINYNMMALSFSRQKGGSAEEDQRRDARIFREFTDGLPNAPVNLCGTGPSLSAALESGYDFAGGINVVCNSAVLNRGLLERLRPRFLIAGDPVFHGGPTAYAGAFRRDLEAAARDLDALIVTQPAFVIAFKAVLDPALHDRIVGLPLSGDKPNIDLRDVWEVQATENILTLYMLPVSCSIGRDLTIFGCDGRSYLKNDYFWGHDKKVQYNDLMSSAFQVHPKFFERNFDHYLLDHCRTMETMFRLAEGKGGRVRNGSPSYLPPLAKRYEAVC